MPPSLRLLVLIAVMLVLPGSRAQAQLQRLELPKADLVVVYKSKRILQLKHSGQVLKTFPIALGPAPAGPKRREGDGRTPEGVYTLDWRNPHSQFYRSLHVSYPQPWDFDRAERWGVSPGGLIMVHGLPNQADTPEQVGHPATDWTNGCIAVSNHEMDEIWARVDDGTTIIIYP